MKNNIMPVKHLFSTLLIVCYLTFSTSANDQVVFNHIGFESGLTDLNINGLYQDEKGTLWIGSRNGVKRYNGNTIESLEIEGLSNSGITAFPTITGDRKGHLYIARSNKLLEYSLHNDTHKVIYTSNRRNSLINFSFSYGIRSLWIGFKDSLFTYKEGTLSFFAKFPQNNTIITSIKETAGGRIYVGTKSNGVFCIDSNLNIRSVIADCSEVISFYEDSKQNIWAGTFNNGVFCINPDGKISNFTTGANSAYRLNSNYVRAICEDNDGTIWLGTMLGLNVIDFKTNTIHQYGLSERGKSGLSNLSVWVILKDNLGTLWFGTYYGGLDYINNKAVSFRYNDFGTHYSGNGYPIIGQIVKDKRGDLWMCTEGKGLLYLNSKTGNYRFIPQGLNSVSTNNLKSLYYDAEKDKLWIGTHLGGLNCLDIKQMRFKHYSVDSEAGHTDSEIVHALTGHKNTLYIGTISGMYEMDLTTEKITLMEPLKEMISDIRSLLVDKNNNLLIAGSNFCGYNIETGSANNYLSALSNYVPSSQTITTALCESSNGEVFIALSGFGLLKLNSTDNTFTPMTDQNKALASTNISCMKETSNGFLLVGTDAGFTSVSLKNGECFNYNSKNGFPIYSMLPGGILAGEENEIIFSGINGVAYFNPTLLEVDNRPFRMYISKLFVNNIEVKTGDKTGILQQNISSTSHIKLKYFENTLSFEIGHDNFVNLGHPVFQYKLTGFNQDWIDFSSENPIKYMNLPYGNYVLSVRAKFKNETESPATELAFRIKPPFYLDWYAYLFYIFIIMGVTTWIIHSSRARLLLKTSLELERRDKEQREKANQSKLRFFANISHELRTPLTLIIGKLELLLSKKSLNNQYNKLKELHQSATEMSVLINELMDFQKHDQGIISIKVVETDIVDFLREIYQSFTVLAELREVSFEFESTEEKIMLFVDKNQMRKVFNNLLANAFKYTSKGGEVKLQIKEYNDTVRVSVVDDGIGISKQHKERIFDCFFQVDNAINNEISGIGTGIGLSLSQSIVKVHSGVLSVESEESKGSSFIVELKKGLDHFRDNEMVEILHSQDYLSSEILNVADETQYQNEIFEPRNGQSTHPTILIVEDDDKLRAMLVQIFDPIALILEARNGNEGLQLVQEKLPDLILSDIMMPGMTGIEMCRKIKMNFDTCHLPVILLTALHSEEQTIDGLNCGADDYITKPFSVNILITKCFGFLNNRRILQEKFSKQMDDHTVNLTTNVHDQNFVDRLINIIESNVGSGELNITLLCTEMGVSRTILFSKMKGITGMTPHEFIQNVKLKLAAKLLRERTDMNVTEVSEYLGFSSLNYFGKIFKEHFGITPTSIKKEASSSTN